MGCAHQRDSQKASQKLYFLILLDIFGVSVADLYDIFTYKIMPIVEYACHVWHTMLTKIQSTLFESIPKWDMNITKPNNEIH